MGYEYNCFNGSFILMNIILASSTFPPKPSFFNPVTTYIITIPRSRFLYYLNPFTPSLYPQAPKAKITPRPHPLLLLSEQPSQQPSPQPAPSSSPAPTASSVFPATPDRPAPPHSPHPLHTLATPPSPLPSPPAAPSSSS